MRHEEFNKYCRRLISNGFIHWDNVAGLSPAANEKNTLSLFARKKLTALYLQDCSMGEMVDFMMNADDVILERLKTEIIFNLKSSTNDIDNVGFCVKNILLLTTDGFIQDKFNDIYDTYKHQDSMIGAA